MILLSVYVSRIFFSILRINIFINFKNLIEKSLSDLRGLVYNNQTLPVCVYIWRRNYDPPKPLSKIYIKLFSWKSYPFNFSLIYFPKYGVMLYKIYFRIMSGYIFNQARRCFLVLPV